MKCVYIRYIYNGGFRLQSIRLDQQHEYNSSFYIKGLCWSFTPGYTYPTSLTTPLSLSPLPSLRRGYVNDDDLIDDDDPDEDYRSLESSSGSDENIANICILLYTCKPLKYILPKIRERQKNIMINFILISKF